VWEWDYAAVPRFHSLAAYDCYWTNKAAGPGDYNEAFFTRDRAGFVHLKGIVGLVGGCADYWGGQSEIFPLVAGYTPDKDEVHPVIAGGGLGRITIESSGSVKVEPPTTLAQAGAWVSLDGISFRCAPSGQNGCP
jgi:hypothetical protein